MRVVFKLDGPLYSLTLGDKTISIADRHQKSIQAVKPPTSHKEVKSTLAFPDGAITTSERVRGNTTGSIAKEISITIRWKKSQSVKKKRKVWKERKHSSCKKATDQIWLLQKFITTSLKQLLPSAVQLPQSISKLTTLLDEAVRSIGFMSEVINDYKVRRNV